MSVEGLPMAGNGGNEFARSRTSSYEEFNGYETAGMMSKQKERSDKAFMVEEDDLLHANVSWQGGVNGVSRQGNEASRRIDLGDPLSFPLFNGGQTLASPSRAQGEVSGRIDVQSFLSCTVGVVEVQPFSSGGEGNNGSVSKEVDLRDMTQPKDKSSSYLQVTSSSVKNADTSLQMGKKVTPEVAEDPRLRLRPAGDVIAAQIGMV